MKCLLWVFLFLALQASAQQRINCGSLPPLTGDTQTLGGTCQTQTQSVNGTTVPASASADQVLLTTAPSQGSWSILTNCGDSGHAVGYSTSTHSFFCQSIAGGGGGSSLWSALTAGINSNAGTFSASGNSWDFTASSIFLLRSKASATTSTNGDLAYNSTTGIWQIWQNGSSKFNIAASNLGTTGQPCLSNADGSCTFADPVVSGPDNPGSAPSRPPVQVSGVNSTGNVTRFLTDNLGDLNVIFPSAQHVIADNAGFNATQSGTWTVQPGNTPNSAPWLFTVNQGGNSATVTGSNALKVDNSAVTQPVSGTITANVGTTNGLALDATLTGGSLRAQGNVASGASDAGNPIKTGGVFNTTQPTVTTGQRIDQQMSARGEAFIAKGVSGFSIDNTGFNATQSGTWIVQPGNTPNSSPWLFTINQGGNSVVVTGSNALKVDNSGVTQPVSGTVTSNIGTTNGLALDATLTGGTLKAQGNSASGASDSGNPVKMGGVFNTTQPTVTTGQRVDQQMTARGGHIVATGTDTFHVTVDSAPTTTVTGTVTANVGTTNGLALDTSVNGILLSQGSTTSGQKGPLVEGAVTTAAPSYTTAQTSPLSLDTSGNLRTSVNNTVTVNNTQQGTASQNIAQIAGNTTSTAATGVQKVGIVGNAGASLDQAPGSAAPANAIQVGGTDGTNTRVPFLDPCGYSSWTSFVISQSTNTQIVAGSASKNIYICQVAVLPAAAAVNFNIVEGTGTTCATGTTGMLGGSTAATGANVAQNGGFILPGNQRAWAKTATSGDSVCMFVSAAAAGVIWYVGPV